MPRITVAGNHEIAVGIATSMRPGLNAPDNSPSWELGG